MFSVIPNAKDVAKLFKQHHIFFECKNAQAIWRASGICISNATITIFYNYAGRKNGSVSTMQHTKLSKSFTRSSHLDSMETLEKLKYTDI